MSCLLKAAQKSCDGRERKWGNFEFLPISVKVPPEEIESGGDDAG